MRVLVLNAGSSTLKASLVEVDPADPGATGRSVAMATVELGDDASRGTHAASAIEEALGTLGMVAAGSGPVDAVAHRVVHGGERFTDATVIDEEVVSGIEALGALAPLHNPVAAAVIRAAMARLTAIPQVALFDTAFHAGLPEWWRRYPVPEGWTAWGIRRYGFHGLSVAWAVDQASLLLERPVGDLGLIVAHLGNGCSVTAVAGGRSVATSMGMTPLEGLMMGTRAGSIDPGIVLSLLRDGRLDVGDLAEVLDHGSGLTAVSGRGADLREIEAAADGGDERAALAIEMFVVRAAAGIAAAATSLDRLDALVFTGGIGEHAGRVRAAIVDRLGVVGIAPIDEGESGVDRVVAGAPIGAAGPMVLRIAAREDLVAAAAAVEVLHVSDPA